jgi:Holliday junction resolvase RusA-like endonuclease
MLLDGGVCVEVTLPPAELSPNGRHHWRRVREAVQSYRNLCHWKAIQVRNEWRGTPMPWPRAEVQLFWYHPVLRNRDADNATASAKAAMDALKRAGIIADDRILDEQDPVAIGIITRLPRIAIDRERPRLEIWVRPLREGGEG